MRIFPLRILVPLVIAASAIFGSVSDSQELEALQTLIDDGRYDEARTLGHELLEEAEAEGDVARSAAILDQIVSAAYGAGDSARPESHELALRAIALKEELLGPGDPGLAVSIHRYAQILAASGDLEGAVAQHRRALEIREQALPADHLDIVQSQGNLADVLSRLARHDEATALFETALASREKVQGPVHVEVGKLLQNMGNNFLRGGDYTRARDACARALAINEQQLGADDPSLAYPLISMGVLYRLTGDFKASRDSYERALQITIPALGPEHPLTLAANNNLANLLNETGDYGAAIPLYERTLAARIKKLGSSHPQVAETHHNLGIANLRLGDYESARMHFNQSLAIWEENLGPEHPRLANSLESMANLEMLSGDVAAAVPLYERALAIRTTGLGPDHPQTSDSHLVLAAALLAEGKRTEALDHALRSVEIQDRHLRETVAYMPERQAMAMVAAQGMPESVLFMGLLSADDDRDIWAEACWNWTLRRRGLVYDELARRNRTVLEGETPEARDSWLLLAAARSDLGALWVEGPGDDVDAFQVSLDRARVRKESAEFELARVSAEFRQRRSYGGATLARLAAFLPPSSALVEIVRVGVAPPTEAEKPVRDIALILRADSPPSFVDLGAASLIDEQTREWRRALSDPANGAAQLWRMPDALARIEETGTRLRTMIWDPVAAELEGVESVFLVPDGAFHLVDLVALPADDGRFLLETGPEIHLLDAARDLARFAESSPSMGNPHGGILAIGNPDFDSSGPIQLAGLSTSAAYRGASSNCEVLAGMDWPPLPESLGEIQSIEALFGGDESMLVLTGSSASEGRFKEEAPGKRWLHLATHGFFLQGECGGETEGESPLLLSGLVFAGANRRPGPGAGPERDDGILTAEELAALDLRGVDLAVLSACDTGRGTIAIGEGVFGLRRAFRIAGASTVVMSLWPVPDEAARAWMTCFYSELAAGTPVGEAVRNASLTRLKELRDEGRSVHPGQWAGFVAVGDWR